MDNRKVYQDALDTWGAEAQTKMLFEEIGELMQAVCKASHVKNWEQRAEVWSNIAEEIADVKILLEQMELLFNVEEPHGRKNHPPSDAAGSSARREERSAEMKTLLDEQERVIFVRMVEWFSEPGPYNPDCLSVKDMANFATYSGSALHGMTERQIRNACWRLKRKGLIAHAWQRENPDQPSGEYGEVWDDSPFIPRHGYGITQAGWNTTLAQETAKRVMDEFVHYWTSKQQEALKMWEAVENE